MLLKKYDKLHFLIHRSPDSALSSGLEKKTKFTPSGPQLWKGFVYMQDVSKFVTSAYRVTGPADNLVSSNSFILKPVFLHRYLYANINNCLTKSRLK